MRSLAFSGLLAVTLAACAAGGLADEPASRIREGHNLLGDRGHAAVRPGDSISSLRFHDVAGKPHVLTAGDRARGPAVFLFLSTQCPLAKRYTGRINRLVEEYAAQKVRFFAVFPNSDETSEGVAAYLKQVAFQFPAVRDVDGHLVSSLGATMTPQAFLLDARGTLRYRGAIDDNRYETRITKRYLRTALEAVLAGQPVEQSAVDAVGCTIHRPDPADAAEVTYARHVARILQDNCQSCHRPGQVAPFPLTSYQEAVRWKTEIKEYTQARLMPPWKAARGYGEFQNDISLSPQEIALLAKWVDSGAAEGPAGEVPPAPQFNDGWAYGEPDLIVEMPEEYVVGPEGEDDYRHFVIPLDLPQHRFVEAVDVRPGNRNVVHHVIAYADTSGKARELDAADPGPGYTRFGDTGFKPASMIGGWAPGNLPVKSPPGSGRWLPQKCDLVLQVHYYRTGVEERDRTKIGLYFSKTPAPVPTRLAVAINREFKLRPGEKKEVVRAEKRIDEPAYLFSVTPHMHLIGKTMQVHAELPDGSKLPIVRIDDWDFNWQTSYRFRKLHLLPAGTVIKLVATFDNSKENPNNPNQPPKLIGWGEKTTDEMCIAFLSFLKQSEYDPEIGGRRQQPGKDKVSAAR